MIAAALGAASLVAQGTCFQIPDNSMTGGNVIPFGSSLGSIATWGNQKYQILVLSSDVNNKPGNVCELAFAPGGTGVRHFDSIRIRLGYFALTGSTLGTNFAANMKNARTVLDAKNYDWPHTADKFNPIGLQNGFAYIPQLGHLVIEITVTGAYIPSGTTGFRNATSSNPGGARQRLYNFRWGTPPVEPTTGTWGSSAGVNVEICYRTAMANIYGLGCAGSNSTIPALSFTGTPKINGTFALNVSGGLPNAKMFLVLGLKRVQTPLLLPGTTNCNAYPSLDVVLLHTMTSTGTFAQKYAVPNNSSLDCTKVYTQAFPWDAKANAFGASASNYGRLRIGQ
jgi:hypothetical protein